jgi:predicted DNA-binding transcriptional regulator AlpA
MTATILPAYVTVREICAALQIQKQTLYRRIAAGQFPPPKKFGRSSRWPVEVVKAVLDELPAETTPSRPQMQRG